MDHILNECGRIKRNSTVIDNIYDMTDSNTSVLLDRIEQFKHQIKEKENQTTPTG
jgi:hypothetical protein